MAEGGLVCLACHETYNLTEISIAGNLPRDLQCGHVCCESCLRREYSNGSVMCPVCGAKTIVNKNLEIDDLPINNWIVGALYAEKLNFGKRTNKMEKIRRSPVREGAVCAVDKENLNLLDSGQCLHNYNEKSIPHRCSPQNVNFEGESIMQNRNSQLVPESMEDYVLLDTEGTNSRQNAESPVAMDVESGLWGASGFTMNSEMMGLIDKAVWIAGCNYERLNISNKSLESLQLKAEKEKNKIAETIHEEFRRIASASQARKEKLLEELTIYTEQNLADITNIRKKIEDKKNYLERVIRTALEIKDSTALKTYCDYKQLLNNLKSTVDTECSAATALAFGTCLRFIANHEEIVTKIENLGKIDTKVQQINSHPEEEAIKLNRTDLLSSDLFDPSSWDSYGKRQSTKSTTSMIYCDVTPVVDEAYTVQNPVTLQSQKQQVLVQSQGTVSHATWGLPEPDVIVEEVLEDDKESVSGGSTSSSTWELRRQKKAYKKKLAHCSPFGQMKFQELVYVRHVINPCHFYVQRYSEKKMATLLPKKLNHFCSSESSCRIPVDMLELGENIFAKSKENGMWCRGTVSELIPSDNKNAGKPNGPTKYAVKDVAVMQVFMVDYGHSEVFIVAGFKSVPVVRPEHVAIHHSVVTDLCDFIKKPDVLMQAELRKISPLAIKCSLKDIVPPDPSEGWSEEARTEFLRIVNNKAVLMKVFKEDGDKLLVDLRKPPMDKISSDMPVSLRDAFVFLELARFCSVDPTPQLTKGRKVALQYCSPVLPLPMSEVSIVVCYVNNPSDFYMHLTDSLEFLVLLKKIEEVYKEGDDQNLEILCPVQGQACVAKFEDGEWYRAKVVGLPGHREVEVKYVDFGNVAKVTVKDLRKIKDDFLSLPEKAIKCQLAHIESVKGMEGWSQQANERFEELTQEKLLLCTVVSILEDNVLSVELYETPAMLGTAATVNNVLVEEGLACFNPGYKPKDLSSKQYSEVWDPGLTEIIKDPVTDDHPTKMDFDTGTPDIFLDLNIKRELQVRVTYVSSPDRLFVQLLSSEKSLKWLQQRMVEEYSKTEPEAVEWQKDMDCAVQLNEQKQWRRGQIVRVISEDLVEVFVYDFGNTERVNIQSVRKLKEELKSVGKLALECCLLDIRPAGGSEKWTATACDFLSLYLTGALVNLAVEENSSEWPLPVRIFCRDEIGQIVNISEHLVKRGLALRKRKAGTTVNRACQAMEKTVEDPLEVIAQSNQQSMLKTNEVSTAEQRLCLSDFLLEAVEMDYQEHESVRNEQYRPPVIPNTDIFHATVTCIGSDGIIYVRPRFSEREFADMMEEIQSNFKCLGLLKPYCWKKGEACVVRGSDTIWYRGKVVEVIGGSIRVQYIDQGYIEKIPQCHLYPSILFADKPQFCIPCELYRMVPVGEFWQSDAIELLKELLNRRCIEVRIWVILF
nr:PREDICTED: RING finger protein 17 isoform X1 [Latimeria chalumnae]|eukprot:XP_014353439.1 PREDICTED: RING finger protein 17 isoform X1 [Latimeria chalumnae]